MENLHLSRTTYQLIKRTVEALERIGRELERYNDRHERPTGEDTGETNSGEPWIEYILASFLYYT